jgi:hypothetical protein
LAPLIDGSASMTRRSVVRLLFALVALCVVGAGVAWWRAVQTDASSLAAPAPSYRPPGPAERPHRVLTPDRRLDRVQHKDASGLSPLEYVETPAGRVTIQRTFTSDGRLVDERALLNGQPVPVPKR